MAIEKQDLREAYNEPVDDWSDVDGYSDNFILYAIALLVVTGIITAIFVAVMGPLGAIVAIIVQLYAVYSLAVKLFKSVDKLVVSRISRREKEILEQIEEE